MKNNYVFFTRAKGVIVFENEEIKKQRKSTFKKRS